MVIYFVCETKLPGEQAVENLKTREADNSHRHLDKHHMNQ